MNEVKITIESSHTGEVDQEGTPEIKYDFEIAGGQSEIFSTLCEFFTRMPKEHFGLWRRAVNYRTIHDLGMCPFCQLGNCQTHTNENKDSSGK